jgi:hypothetical protein
MDTERKLIALESCGIYPNNIKKGDVYPVAKDFETHVELVGYSGMWDITLFKPYVEVNRNGVSMESNSGNFFRATNDPEHPVIDLSKVVGFQTIKKPVAEINPTIGVEESKDLYEGIVTKPSHYTRWAIEPIEFLFRNRVEGHIFNIVKYSMRAGHKLYPGMDAVQSEIVDLKKAARYIEMRINLLEGREVL